MRALGVPARIVTGYQGADPTPSRRLLRRAPEPRPRLGRVLAGRARLGARRPDRRGGARPHRAQPASCAPRAGPRGRRAATREPGAAGAAARALGGDQQPLEPVGAATTRAASSSTCCSSLGFATPSWEDLALLLIALVSGAALAGAGWALVGPPPRRSLAAPARARAASACATARRRRGAARGAARAGRSACASASARARRGAGRSCSSARARSATAAPRSRAAEPAPGGARSRASASAAARSAITRRCVAIIGAVDRARTAPAAEPPAPLAERRAAPELRRPRTASA